MSVNINIERYREKVLGCWMGKNIGGTLGAPFEWFRQENDVSFYTQALGGEPLPNDDLDIQLLWLVALEERGADLDAAALADYWCLYVTPHWSEYGTAKINMRRGLLPPLSGTVGNAFKDSCGAWIRSEIWACVAPGRPDLAARYALADAMLDHGDGEGSYAEVFCAAMESAAFVLDNLRACIDAGLSYIPAECGIAAAVRTAIECHEQGLDWRKARELILERHRGSAFFNLTRHVSQPDIEKGFHEGQLGYDAPSNIAILVYGLLDGGKDFDRMICTTVNMGEDTDCTAATAGAMYGLLYGLEAIPQRWIEPIGTTIKTACLNLGELGYFGNQLPADIHQMTERTEAMARQVLARKTGRGRRVTLSDAPVEPHDLDATALSAEAGFTDDLYAQLAGGRFSFDFFDVDVDYAEGPFIRSGEAKTVRLTLRNRYKVQASVALRWLTPEGWTVSPAPACEILTLPGHLGSSPALEFTLTAPRVEQTMNRATVELTVNSRPTVMHLPITLLNGNLPQ